MKKIQRKTHAEQKTMKGIILTQKKDHNNQATMKTEISRLTYLIIYLKIAHALRIMNQRHLNLNQQNRMERTRDAC